jgi:hypothetical protein
MSLSETFLVSPLSVPGCQLWLDATDVNGNGTSLANGASISTWTDKSGRGNNATGGVSPTFSNNTVTFNGTTQYLTIPGISSFPSNESWFAVFQFTGTGTNKGWNLLGSSSVTGGRGMQVYRVTTDYNFGADKWGFGTIALTPILQNTTCIGDFTYASGPTNGIFNVYVNGVVTSGSPQTVSFSGSGGTNLGVGSSGNFFWQGTISELVSYNLSLTTSDRQKIEGYLAWKWGLTGSLPSTHPYKNSRPLDGIPLPTSLLVPARPLRNVFVFNPTVLSNCVLWLDGADVSTMFQNSTGTLPVRASGSTVSLWKDKSVSANHASNTTAQPTVNFNAQNGLPLVNFSGSQYLTLSTSSLPTGATECTFFFLTRTTSSAVQVFFTYGAEPNTANRNPQFFYNTGVLSTDLYGGGGLNDNINYVNSYVITSCIFTTTRNTAWDNGTQFSGGSTAITLNTGTGWASIGVGRIPPGNVLSYYLTGQMGELVVFNRALNEQQRQQMEGYLAWKWGVQANLPLTHPFRTNPPDLPAAAPRGIPQLKSAFFNPRTITGIQLWLDAADAGSRTVIGATVSQLNDKSGNGYNATQTTVASRPTLAAINLVQFANNTYFDFSQAAINNTTRYALFLIFNPIASVNWIIQKQYNGVGSYNMLSMTNYWQNNVGTTNYLYWGPHANTGVVNAGTALSLNTLQLIEVLYDGTRVSFYRNGTLLNTATSGPTLSIVNQLSATNCTIGSWRPDGGIQNSGVTNFLFGELVYHNVAFSIAQRQAMEGYLAWKWKLQGNLPSTHPFKLFPPSP